MSDEARRALGERVGRHLERADRFELHAGAPAHDGSPYRLTGQVLADGRPLARLEVPSHFDGGIVLLRLLRDGLEIARLAVPDAMPGDVFWWPRSDAEPWEWG